MVKFKNKIAPFLLVVLIVGLCCVPASAADNTLFSGNRVYFPMAFSWIGTADAENLTGVRQYERNALLSVPGAGADTYEYFYGAGAGTSQEGVLAQLTIDSQNANYNGYGLVNYNILFIEQEAALCRFDLLSPVFVPESTSQIEPVFQLMTRAFDCEYIGTIEGYYIERVYNADAESWDQKWTPFTVSFDEVVTAGEYFDLELPRGDLYVTKIRCSMVSPDQSIYTIDQLYVRTSFLSGTQYNDYNEDVAAVLRFSVPVSSDVNVDFVSWLTTAVGAFWDFEIVPGLSIEGVFFGLLGIGVVLAFLKFFAGG